MSQLKEYTTLNFSARKQMAVLGWLIADHPFSQKFFNQAKDVIKPEWFLMELSSSAWRLAVGRYQEFGKKPTRKELEDCNGATALYGTNTSELRGFHSHIAACIEETKDFNYETLLPELTEWFHSRVYAQNVEKSVKLFNQEKYPDSYDVIKEVVETISKIRFDQSSEMDFSDPRRIVSLAQQDVNQALTFGIKIVDECLLEGQTNGGLLPGDTTTILASSGIGKTSSMITVACANILKGRKVLFISHEGRPEDIQIKFYQCMLAKDKLSALNYLATVKEDDLTYRHYVDLMCKNLSYIPYNKPGATIEDVESLIRRKFDERGASNGKAYDLVVCDYPAKLTTTLAAKGNLQKRHIDDIVYGRLVNLALELKFHNLVAIQTNRDGSRSNRGFTEHGKEKEHNKFLTTEDVMESWGVMTQSTNVISINRTDAEKARNLVTFYIDKSRSSETGFAVVCKSSYAKCITHSNDLGGVYYKGITSHSKIDSLMEQYNGQAIPHDKLFEK